MREIGVTVSIPYNWGVIQTIIKSGRYYQMKVSIPYNWGVIQTDIVGYVLLDLIVSIPYNWGVIQTHFWINATMVSAGLNPLQLGRNSDGDKHGKETSLHDVSIPYNWGVIQTQDLDEHLLNPRGLNPLQLGRNSDVTSRKSLQQFCWSQSPTIGA